MEEIRKISAVRKVDAVIHLPPSKSYTNRTLIAAALADGTSVINNPSKSEDAGLLIRALREFGIVISSAGNGIEVIGSKGNLRKPGKEVYVGNAGTAMRFLTSLACLVPGETILVGDKRMNCRPIKDLLDALTAAGIECSGNEGFPPVKIKGGNFKGGLIDIEASLSSQFVSSVLLIAPYAGKTTVLNIKGVISSVPYVSMTLHVMKSFGASVVTSDMKNFVISCDRRYTGQKLEIEADVSAATYFLGAAAVTKGRVQISNMPHGSLQGDSRFLNILSDMGCKIIRLEESIEIQGGNLNGIEVDMNDIPDCVPTLAVVAAFARGATRIKNVGNLRYKETDRLKALVKELSKLGTKVEINGDDITIYPHKMRGAVIETYNDHRIAMSFAVAGLAVEGIMIRDPVCVKKSFPSFWDEFKKLESGA